MVQALRMPMMGNTMETGLLAEWVVGEGDPVEADQVLAVVESEKAAADVVAKRDGTLARVDVEEGEEVPPGTLIGVVLGPDEDVGDAPPPRSRVEPGGGDGEREKSAPEGESADRAGPTQGARAAEDDAERASEAGGVRAAPGARRLAGEEGVDLEAVEGTGPDGAVLIADVEEHVDGESDAEPATSTDGPTFLPPSTRRLARELGVDPGAVEGTGAGGRVTESDVRAAAGATDAGAATGTSSRSSGNGTDGREHGIAGPPPRDPSRLGVTVSEERELAGVRRTVAERMSRSARDAPQVTLYREVGVGRVFETAEELELASTSGRREGTKEESEESEGRATVGFTDLLVGAAVRALERHPEFNAWYEGDALRLIEEVNVAVAVDAATGLLTPVVRDAGSRTLAGIARERRRLTDAVLDGRHGMDDLQGGTFTVSNLGPFGVDSFDPILDPPQVAILGVGRVVEGSCTLSLTFDHRVVDGADAARFLDTLAAGLESPSVVVAERTAAGGRSESSGTGTRPGSPANGPDGPESVETAVAADLADRARAVAAAHDWPVPEFEVRLGGDRPVVGVRGGEGDSPATLRRLTYAACRESRYADTIAGLRDPEIELPGAFPATATPDERD
jgi:pyruvate dehydrogenase E2 component (dihydrolipoamide acetyltransferase)